VFMYDSTCALGDAWVGGSRSHAHGGVGDPGFKLPALCTEQCCLKMDLDE
jgi:hypothetical protein